MATEELRTRRASESGGHEHVSSDVLRAIRATMDESFAGVLITDAAGVIEHVNRSFETMSGYSAAELVGRSIAGLSTDDDLEQSILVALDASGHWRGEIKSKRPDGEEIYMLASIQPLRSDDGEIRHYIGIGTDITGRVKAEGALAEREAYWRALVENAPDHILSVDRDGVIKSLNWTESGVAVDEAIGRTVFDFVRDEYHDVWREALANVFAGGQRAEFEVRTIGGPGEPQWYSNTLSAVYDGDTVTAAITSSRNVTARKEAEEALAEREAFWRALVENAPDHILAVDKDGVIKSLNWTVRGATVDEAAGPTVYDFVREEYHDAWREALAEVFAGGRRVEVEARTNVGGPEDSQWYANVLGPVYDGDVVLAAIVSSRNVTARKKIEEALAEREAYWRALVKNAPDLIAEVDRDGVIARLNRDPVGSTMEAVVGRTVYDFSLPESHAVWREALAKAFTEGERVDFDVEAADAYGEVRWYATSIAPVYAADGVVATIVSERDITARREAEQDLAEREAYWRALVENATDHILTVDKDGVITSLNWSGDGLTVDRVVGATVYDFVREEYRDAWREALAKVFNGEQRVEFEVKKIGGPAEAEWYANTLSAVYDGETVVAGIATLRSITTLKEAEERMRAIATAISDVIVVVDEDGVLLEVLAPRTEGGLLRLPPELIRGRRVQEFLPQDQAEQVLGFVRETISSGKPGEDEALFDLPRGPTWLSSRSAPLTLSDGRAVAVIHTLNVTEHKRLEEELQRLREEAEVEAEAGVKRASQYELTFREVTVLSLIARGKSDKEIALLLGLSPFTVNKHSSNLVRKMGARSRSEAAARAAREGIV